MSKLTQILPIFYFLVDVSILVFSFVGVAFFIHEINAEGFEWIMLASVIALWLIIGYSRKLYRLNLHNGFMPRIVSYIKSYLIFAALILSLAYLTSRFPLVVANVLFAFIIVFLVLDISANFILINIISRIRRNPENIKHTLVAGVGDLAAKISDHFKSNPDYGYQIKGFLSVNGEACKVDKHEVVGTIGNIKEYLNYNPVDEIVIALPYKASKKNIKNIIHEADFHGVRVSYVPDYQGLFGKNFKIFHEDEFDAINVRQLPLDEMYSAIIKEIFDTVFSAVVLVMLAPVFLFIAIIIKLDSPGPVFYCPVRVGRGGKNFTLYKFRTMRENDAAFGGTLSTQKNDPRITKVGRILRKYSLDELPQFLNVFLGEMSVVGPRPHRNFLNQQMKEHVDKYMVRHYFKPGITGWAQVNGWRGPTETEEEIRQRTMHDLWYIENWSFMLDLKIIWLTIFSRKALVNAF